MVSGPVTQAVLSIRDPEAHLRAVYQAFDESGSRPYRQHQATHGYMSPCSFRLCCTGLGFIRREDALRIFKDAAPAVKRSTVEEVFDELDIGLTGRVSCDAFISALRSRRA
ncbi:hypothetical protein Agub_g5334 [Astrephomene gubernaculifera]|uniref:EF-hand domain-containing protein n=1 Tax=Astrephomene gubernaculifera TaxID=47775 RepID=A0AAD3HK12_9CHLO|nr:hypothetical protein Agub_g5334 [Astrephomene gubernaculifera]